MPERHSFFNSAAFEKNSEFTSSRAAAQIPQKLRRPQAGQSAACPGLIGYRSKRLLGTFHFAQPTACPYLLIARISGLKYGISQITHTTTLNLWKLVIKLSSLRTKTTVAQIACINIRMMASMPVSP